ncbi:cytokine-dependent hematopoietic cell linker [Labrus mixtus]|uniref:cytokine-dependent hematopoietic cell linker n=1 Tax=Labrus mixtus TaxID=508554 RepID=UPI0029BFB570|nr:cytokine-dependent hematopoietic cell linker [Labrus mixtus]
MEPEYDVVDDQKEELNVRIFPARPIHEEREYADRDLPRTSSAQSLSSPSAGNPNPRKVPLNPTSGPAVNRDLKPGRKKTRVAQKLPPAQPGLKPSYRCSSSPSPFASELENRLSALTIRDPCRRDGHRDTHKADFSPHSKGPQSAQHVSSQRLSLDLETHDLEKRSQHNLERGASKRQHHEWPQTKEDFDQHNFVPMEKLQQTYCEEEEEEDWYVGPCTRADAEHALHLVNKDGAFLVRDCSISSDSEPLVLAVFHDKKVYNVKIRFLESDGKYALGNGQRSNDMFVSVAEIIKFHSIFPIVLISGRSLPGSRYPENCVLTCPITKRDVDLLLQ